MKLAQATGGGHTASTSWSRAPIDVSALNTLDAQLVLTVDRMNHGKVKLTDGRLVTLLNKGLLRINVEKISLYGGRGTGRVSVDGVTAIDSCAEIAHGAARHRLATELRTAARVAGFCQE